MHLTSGTMKFSGEMESWHPSIHPTHPLLLIEEGAKEFSCKLCRQSGSGSCYCCKTCDLSFHTFCTSCPKTTLLSSLHPQHQLTFENTACSICFRPPSSSHPSLFYSCTQCRFHVHPSCHHKHTPKFFNRIFPKSTSVHHHALTLSRMSKSYVCQYCHQEGKGDVYRCNFPLCNCNLNLHPICDTAPGLFYSPLHKEHELVLDFHGKVASHKCSKCRKLVDGAFYACRDCNFYVHPLCLPPLVEDADTDSSETEDKIIDVEENGEENVYFFMHPQHSLVRSVNRSRQLKLEEEDPPFCKVCREPAYQADRCSCSSCKFHVHGSCISLIKPSVIDRVHTKHVLLYLSAITNPCIVCKELCSGWRYHCILCNVSVHKNCLQGEPDPSDGSS